MDVQQARIFGNIAFARGDRRSPSQDAAFMDGLTGVPIGGGIPLSRSWLNGWDEAHLAAALLPAIA